MRREVVLAVTVELQLLGEEEEMEIVEGMVGEFLLAAEMGGYVEEEITVDGPIAQEEEGEVVVVVVAVTHG